MTDRDRFAVPRLRLLAALGALVLAAVGLSACGGIAPDAVVEVNGSSITKATFGHWMEIGASATKTSAASRAIVPEPPDYSACIAHLAASSAKPSNSAKAPSAARLKSECEQQYKSLRMEVLGFLISADWVIGESSSLGIELSDAEVKRELVRQKVVQFPQPSKFETYLQQSGETVSDVLLNLKVHMLEQKLERAALKGKGKGKAAQQKAFNGFVARFRKKWTAKTDCRSGYIVAECKQYRAPKAKL